MSVTGKVAEAGGGEGAHRPLCKGFKTLSVLQLMRGSGEGSWSCARERWEDGAPRRLSGAGLCPPWGHRACAAMGDPQEHLKPKKDLKAPLLVSPPPCLSPNCRAGGEWPQWSLCPERGGFVPLSLGWGSESGAPGQSTLEGRLDAQQAAPILLLTSGLKITESQNNFGWKRP